MSRTYRCYGCKNPTGQHGVDFPVDVTGRPAVKLADSTTGPEVACPKCGTSNADPSFGMNVVPVSVIHFEPPKSDDLKHERGRGTIACNPKKRVMADNDLRYTGEPSVVNCPACKETAEFKKASGGFLHPTFDVILPDDLTVPEPEFTPPAAPAKPEA